MNDIEYILDFAANLGCRMLAVGANLERANDTMYRVCRSYGLDSISIFSLNTLISISAKSQNLSGTRQVSVPAADSHMEKLNRFNQLSRRVCAKTPPPQSLAGLLEDAEKGSDYSKAVMILGYLTAMSSTCILFGGSFRDVIAADISTVILYYLAGYLDKRYLNNIIVNALCMYAAGTLAILYIRWGLGEHYFIIIITNSMMRMPGIALVNAVRNILCGNEMNGILQFLKVVLEAMAIVCGLTVSIFMFGGLIQW